MYPHHIDSLIQLSDICRMGDDTQMAAELIERALYIQESAFHPSFNLASGNCRLEYRQQENRSLTHTSIKMTPNFKFVSYCAVFISTGLSSLPSLNTWSTLASAVVTVQHWNFASSFTPWTLTLIRSLSY